MKTASTSYDAIPYPSKIFFQTNPDRLSVMAKIFGMNPAPIESARILELGCGNGSNLLAQAFVAPTASFVGIDLSENHIAQAQAAARELNLSNIEFRQIDLMQMQSEAFGKFDYIIAHGLISWIPEAVREKVLEIYSTMLASNGVGYISYNAYPGGHIRDMVRRMMRYHTRRVADPQEKVGEAISFLAFAAEHATEKEGYQQFLQRELKRHFEHEAADIFHDDLAEFYQPFYFYEFARLLGKYDLQFLSEAEISAMSVHSFSPQVQEKLSSLSDIVEREQYLDFLRGRFFRQTLVCRQEIKLNHNIEPAVLRDFYIAASVSPLSENPDLAPGKVEKFVNQKRTGVEIDHPLTKAALIYLGEIWANAVSYAQLVEEARRILENRGFQVSDSERDTDILTAILWRLYSGPGLVELYPEKTQISTVTGEKPKVNRLARLQIKYGQNISTLLGMNIKIEDEVSGRLIELMDGTRTRDELAREMRQFVENLEDMLDKEEWLATLPEWLNQNIDNSARMGLFENEK